MLALIFDLDTPTASREDALDRLLPPVLDDIESKLEPLGKSPMLVGNEPSGADAYTFWALLLLRHHDATLIGPASRSISRAYELLAIRSYCSRNRNQSDGRSSSVES